MSSYFPSSLSFFYLYLSFITVINLSQCKNRALVCKKTLLHQSLSQAPNSTQSPYPTVFIFSHFHCFPPPPSLLSQSHLITICQRDGVTLVRRGGRRGRREGMRQFMHRWERREPQSVSIVRPESEISHWYDWGELESASRSVHVWRQNNVFEALLFRDRLNVQMRHNRQSVFSFSSE